MMIIGLHGAIGAGKDTAAGILQSALGYSQIGMADAIRSEIVHAFNCPITLLTEREGKEIPTSLLALDRCLDNKFVSVVLAIESTCDDQDTIDAILTRPRSPRQIQEYWGTDYRRKTVREEYWLDIATEALTGLGNNVVISDIRNPNEADWAHTQGGIIWEITRPGHEYDNRHPSRGRLPETMIDTIIHNDGDLLDLHCNILHALGMRAAA
jgi:rhodanese-related sulfurtransferase